MKTKNNELKFSKNSITELSDYQTSNVNGGCQWGDSSGSQVELTKKISIINDPDDKSLLQ